ncbi:MAG: DUF4188 domain-containing protein [Gemmobacter sp.]
MARIPAKPYAARIAGDFVVFLIGMRINKPWKVGTWWPVFWGMGAMVAELEKKGRESGFLGHTPLRMLVNVQYWRSFDHLEAYARSKDALHWPAWVALNRRIKDRREDIGFWHETYLVRAGEYETTYSGMPLFGLAGASEAVDHAPGRMTARERLRCPLPADCAP